MGPLTLGAKPLSPEAATAPDALGRNFTTHPSTDIPEGVLAATMSAAFGTTPHYISAFELVAVAVATAFLALFVTIVHIDKSNFTYI